MKARNRASSPSAHNTWARNTHGGMSFGRFAPVNQAQPDLSARGRCPQAGGTRPVGGGPGPGASTGRPRALTSRPRTLTGRPVFLTTRLHVAIVSPHVDDQAGTSLVQPV